MTLIQALKPERRDDGSVSVTIPWDLMFTALESFVLQALRKEYPELASGPASCSGRLDTTDSTACYHMHLVPRETARKNM